VSTVIGRRSRWVHRGCRQDRTDRRLGRRRGAMACLTGGL